MTGPLLIKAARLLDGSGSPPLERGAVLVEGDTISSVFEGPVPESGLPAGTRVLDFPSGTLLPGLIDTHVHLNLPGDGTPYLDTVAEDDGVLVATAAHNARVALESGITTLRDTGGRGLTTFSLRRAQQLGYAAGPTLILCGSPITITGGHTWHFGGEADGVEGVRQKAREMVRRGADFIKVMGSGGGTPGTMSWRPSYTRAELAAVADEAHNLGRKVTVHCLCPASIDYAIDAGVDQIEHAGFIVDEAGEQRFDERVAEKLARSGIPVTSTLAVGEYILRHVGEQGGLGEEEARYRERWVRMRADNVSQVGRLHRAGVRFVAGTDAGWRLTPYDALHDEIRWLHEAGLSPLEAIVAGTGGAAAAIGVEDRVGVVRPGATADLLVVEGDPLGDLAALRRARLVVQRGEPRPLAAAN